ncbi:MAG: helix-turn-helix transcriptional regulator [Rhodospirillales bacterium]
MTRIRDLHEKWLRDPHYRDAYEALAPEFELARTLIEARTRAGLTQQQVAQRMNTTQSAVARLESGHTVPSTKTLQNFAKATGTRLRITLEPADAA